MFTIVVFDLILIYHCNQVAMALSFLNSCGIAHRDVRSDNLLVNQSGVVKLGTRSSCFCATKSDTYHVADFSNSVKVTDTGSLCDEPAGVIYWQVRLSTVPQCVPLLYIIVSPLGSGDAQVCIRHTHYVSRGYSRYI